MMNKKTIVTLCGLGLGLLLLFSLGGAADQAKNKSLVEPVNPAFINYMNQVRSGVRLNPPQSRYKLNYAPAPVSVSHIKGVKDEAVNNTEYPSYFNLRDLGLVTWMKSQTGYPACWAFAAFASLEACQLPDELLDFSEWHLINHHGFDYTLEDGSSSWVTSAYLNRWTGPIKESVCPYPTAYTITPPPLEMPLAKHIQQIIFLPEREHTLDNNTVKYFLMNYGPVDFAFNWEFESFNRENNSMYTPYIKQQNHRLAIVGWDDNYPASNFIHTPPGNGAFIARNSWGIEWGDEGYCYISYYDESFQEFTCFNNAEPTTNYESIYQHDYLGRTSSWGEKDAYGANIFTAVNSKSVKAVGFYTNDANVLVEIYVYKNVDANAGSPTAGTLAAYKTAGFTYAGYYTVVLDNLVPLTQGETFSIVMRWTNPNFDHAVPIERPIPNHSSAAVGYPGESYVSLNGTDWVEATSEVDDSNVCIKAYTEFPQVDVSIRAQRKVVFSWLARRDYVDINFSVADLGNVPVTYIVLYKKINDTQFVEHTRLSPDQMNGGSYQLREFIDSQSTYTYKVLTYDNNDAVTGRSQEVIIQPQAF